MLADRLHQRLAHRCILRVGDGHAIDHILDGEIGEIDEAGEVLQGHAASLDGGVVEIHEVEVRVHVQQQGLAGEDIAARRRAIGVDDMARSVARPEIVDVVPGQPVAARRQHMRAQLIKGRHGAVGQAPAIGAGSKIIEGGAGIGPGLMAVEHFGRCAELVLVQRVRLPFAQQHGDLLVRAIGLALVDIGRGMVGVGRGLGLDHGAMRIIRRAIETIGPCALHIVVRAPDPVGARDGQGAAMQVDDRVAIGRGAGDGDGEIAGILDAIGSRRPIEWIARLQRDDDLRALASLVQKIESMVEELAEQGEDAAGGRVARQGVLVADDGLGHLRRVAVRIGDGLMECVGGGADPRHGAVGHARPMVHVGGGDRLGDHARGIVDH